MMSNLRKLVAREWLTLIVGVLFGFFVLPALVYALFSPASYTATHSLFEGYGELTGLLFGKNHRDAFIGLTIVLGPYIVYQFMAMSH